METKDLQRLLEELKKNVKKGDVYYSDNKIKRLFNELIKEALTAIPDKSQKLIELKKKIMERNHGPFGSDLLDACMVIEGFLKIKDKAKTSEGRSFLKPDDLIKNAGIALRNGQDSYVIHLCDTAIETFLKDSFDVPSTIVGAGNVKFLSECIILDIPKGLNLYLKEVKNKVSQIDNQIKHKAYAPSRLDAINALKSIEELFARKSWFKNLTSEEKRKVQIGVGIK